MIVMGIVLGLIADIFFAAGGSKDGDYEASIRICAFIFSFILQTFSYILVVWGFIGI